MPRQQARDHFGRGPRRDLVDQCSAYACPMRAHARLTRRTTSTCRSPRNRSSPATSRRAHPAYACVCRVDKAPRKTPEKLGSSTRAPARTRWSQRCAYAKAREEPDELVAGGRRDEATRGLRTTKPAGQPVCIRAMHTQPPAQWRQPGQGSMVVTPARHSGQDVIDDAIPTLVGVQVHGRFTLLRRRVSSGWRGCGRAGLQRGRTRR